MTAPDATATVPDEVVQLIAEEFTSRRKATDLDRAVVHDVLWCAAKAGYAVVSAAEAESLAPIPEAEGARIMAAVRGHDRRDLVEAIAKASSADNDGGMWQHYGYALAVVNALPELTLRPAPDGGSSDGGGKSTQDGACDG